MKTSSQRTVQHTGSHTRIPCIALPALPKPRNPLVAAAHMRAAGRHGPDGGARRQRERQALRHELSQAGCTRWPRGEP